MALPKQTSWNELVRKFKALGWTGPEYGSKHPFMNKGKHRQRIPNPHGSDIGAPLLAVFRPGPTKGLEFPNKFIPGGLLWEGHTLGNRIEVNLADNRNITILVLNLEE